MKNDKKAWVDYDKFSKTFSQSRKSMKWDEIDYFIDNYFEFKPWVAVLDVWAGTWRLLEHFWKKYDISKMNYMWIDLSEKMLEEAKKDFPDRDFFVLNMTHIDEVKADCEFDYIFFIASFHHLQFEADRFLTIKKAYNLLKPGWMIFMTNWALNSKLNYEKYTDSIVEGSENEYGSVDYNIYIWEYPRYYHCFNLSELQDIFQDEWFEIIENREFENQKNLISIVRKY